MTPHICIHCDMPIDDNALELTNPWGGLEGYSHDDCNDAAAEHAAESATEGVSASEAYREDFDLKMRLNR